MKKIYLLLLVLVTLFVACNEDRDVEFATFTVVNEKITPSYTSVELSCQVRCAATINELYLQYDTVAAFSTYQSVQLEINKKTKVYSVKIGDLLDNTKYYVRYVAVNSYSQVTSEEVSEFKTLQATTPTIEVREITDVLDTVATVDFVLKFDGGAEISKLGICWSMDSVPTIDGEHVECSSDVVNSVSDGDLLFLNISGLEANTTYYVRAYAENKMGIGYSMSKSFLTLDLPEVKTGEVTDIKSGSVVLNGEAVFNGNDATTEYGFCWGEESMPTFEGDFVRVDKANFSSKLSNLKAETKYYVRAYAKNKIGIVYGAEKEFVTKMAEAPVVETIEVTDITYNSAKVGGNVVSTGGVEITERGVCYSTTENPTIENSKKVVDGGFGGFTVVLSGLQLGTKYYVRAYAQNKKGVSYGEQINFETKDFKENGYRYVDLGLSVKWATCNIGAIKPEEYGDYFAWGEIKSKEIYDWKSYKYGKSEYSLVKYCTQSRYGYNDFTDNKTVLDLSDDAAHVNWGGTWRMPTEEEMEELIYKCRWTWTTQNGVNGYEVTGPNENSIFLPAAGRKQSSSLYDAGSYGRYWSSSLDDGYSSEADYVYFDSDDVGRGSYGYRYYGQSIRPVYGESSQQPEIKRYTISVYSHDNSRGIVSGGGTYNEGSQVTITATAKSGYRFKEWNDGNMDNSRVITVTKDAIYTAHFEEEKNLNVGHEYVDLGLPSGLKWATCNVGANVSEEYGDYFAWGEVELKETYDWSTYKYGTDEDQLTKYCNKSSYGKDGFTDNKTVLDPEDDAATANWGGAWRMPTKAEMTELREKCTWKWTTQNGVNGYKVIGPNGNSIFLPAAGLPSEGTLVLAGSYGYYRSSSLSTDDPRYAYYVKFDSDNVRWGNGSRDCGLYVRPVCQ